jgi:hypothetical protein
VSSLDVSNTDAGRVKELRFVVVVKPDSRVDSSRGIKNPQVATVLESDGTPNTTEWLRDHQAPVSEAAKATRDRSAVLVRDVPCVCAGCGRSK